MQRRDFITLLAGAAAALPLAAYAQQAVKLHRIGILSPELPPPGFLDAFRQGLRELGYVEGQNIAFEIRSAERYGQRLAALANHLVELKVDVIVAVNTPSVQAAKGHHTSSDGVTLGCTVLNDVRKVFFDCSHVSAAFVTGH